MHDILNLLKKIMETCIWRLLSTYYNTTLPIFLKNILHLFMVETICLMKHTIKVSAGKNN